METVFWQYAALCIILFFFCMYSILDGFDLGVGMIMPFLKKKDDADKMLGSISPLWDGNEVWIVMGAGAIFASFPGLYASLMSTFYLPIITVVGTLILRAVSIEFSYHDKPHELVWRTVIAVSSFVATVGGVWLIGILLIDLSSLLSELPTMPGNLFSLFPLVFSFAGVLIIIWHGLVFSIGKETIGVHPAFKVLWIAILALAIITASLWFFQSVHNKPFGFIAQFFVIVGTILFFGGLIASRFCLHKKDFAFRCSCMSIIGIWLAIAGSFGSHLSEILVSAAPVFSLRIFVIVSIVITPFILWYTFFVHRIFKTHSKTSGYVAL